MDKIELIAPCHFGLEAVLKREILDLGYEIAEVEDGDTRVEACDGVFEILHFLGELAAHIAYAVDFGKDSLELKQGLEALFYWARSFGFLICCHR